MSTRQTVFVTFMIVFLATTVFSLGAWLHYWSEWDTKTKTLSTMHDRWGVLDRTLRGSEAIGLKGLRQVVEDPVDGLETQLTNATKRTVEMEGDESKGVKQRVALYEQKGKDFEGKKPGAEAKWKALYDNWLKLNGDIDGAMKKLKSQRAEAEQKTAEAQAELDREQANEQTEKKKITEEKRKQQEDISQIRAQHEQVLDKVSEVTRETRKVKTLAPQGHVIEAAPELGLVTVDVGWEQGVRKGLQFDVYASALGGQVKKASIEITMVRASSSTATILPPKTIKLQDPVTGWVPTDPRMKYSVYAAGGTDETTALELVKPKTREDRIETYRIEKMERELGAEAAEKYVKEKEEPTHPPPELGKGFVPIVAGDWINNPDFVPIIPETAYQKRTMSELVSMQDVNLSTLTFYFADSVRTYRKEFLRRLCERNRCKTVDAMSADVNYVVSAAGLTRVGLLEDRLQAVKEKKDEEISADQRIQRKTLAALLEAKKIGALVIADDEVEGFFAKRQRKAELLRGKTVQPGRSTFFVAGETKERSVAQTRAWIKDHGGVPANELTADVDYVVVGSGLDQAFFDKVKKLGVKVMREDELGWFFGRQ